MPGVKQWSYTLVTTILLVGVAGTPGVLDLICRHRIRSAAIVGVWAVVGNFLPTPIKKINGWLG